MIYRWRNGQSFGVPAQVAGDRLETLRDEKGVLRARDVVEDARPKKAVLHNCFEWDNLKAAEEYRVAQARQMLAALVIVPIEAPDSEPVRALIAIGESNEPNDYMPLSQVMTSEELRKRALNIALADLRRTREKYHHLKELEKVWEQLDLLAESVV